MKFSTKCKRTVYLHIQNKVFGISDAINQLYDPKFVFIYLKHENKYISNSLPK